MHDQRQLLWEDVRIGDDITPLAKIATSQMLAKWAGACGDFNPLHYEDAFAKAQGFERPVVHGQLKRAWLVQMLTDWIGDGGWLKKLSCQIRRADYPRLMRDMANPWDGETWWCKGSVTAKHREGIEHSIECDIWVENGEGERTTIGTATVVLPSIG